MTLGDRLVASLTLKTSFYDAHERRAYLRMVEVARQIVDDPALIERGRAFLEQFVRNDPRQAAAYQRWMLLLLAPPEQIASELLADSADGASLRDSAPVFVAFSREQARDIWSRSA